MHPTQTASTYRPLTQILPMVDFYAQNGVGYTFICVRANPGGVRCCRTMVIRPEHHGGASCPCHGVAALGVYVPTAWSAEQRQAYNFHGAHPGDLFD